MTEFFLSKSSALLHPFLSSVDIFMLAVPLNFLTVYLHISHGPATHDFRLLPTPMVSIPFSRVNQQLNPYIPPTVKTSINLPLSMYPPVYDFNSSPMGVSNHLFTKN